MNSTSFLSSPGAAVDLSVPGTQTAARRRLGVAAVAVTAALLLGACSNAAAPTGTASGPVVDPSAAANAKGSVNVCGPKDASGVYKATAEAFTKSNTATTAKYTEIGANTDDTRTQAVQRLEAKSTECDVFVTDVIWTAEFASQGWLSDHGKFVEKNQANLIPSTVETTKYEGKYWGVPFVTNAGLIYYQKDKVSKPETWQQLYTEAAKTPESKFVFQGKQYEGLTVNFLEMLYSAGGEVLNDNGDVKIDSPQSREVLQFMVDGLKNGSNERAVLTYDEDATRLAYESGNFGYERNWPHVYRLLNATKLAGTFGVAPLPAWDGAKASGVLGGSNLAVSAFSANPDASAAFINFAISPDWQKHTAVDYLRAPVNEAAYADAEVLQKMPFAPELLESVKNAKPRPVSPVYPQISQAINKNAFAALSGTTSVEAAVKKMAEEINAAKKSF